MDGKQEIRLKVTVELHGIKDAWREFYVPLDPEDVDLDGRDFDKIANEAIIDQGIIGVSWEVVDAND